MMKANFKRNSHLKRLIIIAISGAILGIALILVTLEISRRNITSFIGTQEKYIISIEAAILAIFLVEILARIISYSVSSTEITNYGVRLRLTVRVVGYLVAVVSVISILASNPTLAISVGAIMGVIIAFATQNIIGNIMAAVLILNTHMVLVGEEITVSGIKGIITDINLNHTIISVNDDIIFIPNSVMMSTAVQRKKRIEVDDQHS